jgi:hypothetical protein
MVRSIIQIGGIYIGMTIWNLVESARLGLHCWDCQARVIMFGVILGYAKP